MNELKEMNKNEIFYGRMDDFILFSNGLKGLITYENKKFLLRSMIHDYSVKLKNEIGENSSDEKASLSIKNAKIFFACPYITPNIRELAKALTFLIDIQDEGNFEKEHFQKIYNDFRNHCLEMGYCPVCGAKLVKDDSFCEWCHSSYEQNSSHKENE